MKKISFLGSAFLTIALLHAAEQPNPIENDNLNEKRYALVTNDNLNEKRYALVTNDNRDNKSYLAILVKCSFWLKKLNWQDYLEKAETLFKKVKNIERSQGEEKIILARILNSFGLRFSESKNPEKAFEYCSKAYELLPTDLTLQLNKLCIKMDLQYKNFWWAPKEINEGLHEVWNELKENLKNSTKRTEEEKEDIAIFQNRLGLKFYVNSQYKEALGLFTEAYRGSHYATHFLNMLEVKLDMYEKDPQKIMDEILKEPDLGKISEMQDAQTEETKKSISNFHDHLGKVCLTFLQKSQYQKALECSNLLSQLPQSKEGKKIWARCLEKAGKECFLLNEFYKILKKSKVENPLNEKDFETISFAQYLEHYEQYKKFFTSKDDGNLPKWIADPSPLFAQYLQIQAQLNFGVKNLEDAIKFWEAAFEKGAQAEDKDIKTLLNHYFEKAKESTWDKKWIEKIENLDQKVSEDSPLKDLVAARLDTCQANQVLREKDQKIHDLETRLQVPNEIKQEVDDLKSKVEAQDATIENLTQENSKLKDALVQQKQNVVQEHPQNMITKLEKELQDIENLKNLKAKIKNLEAEIQQKNKEIEDLKNKSSHMESLSLKLVNEELRKALNLKIQSFVDFQEQDKKEKQSLGIRFSQDQTLEDSKKDYEKAKVCYESKIQYMKDISTIFSREVKELIGKYLTEKRKKPEDVQQELQDTQKCLRKLEEENKFLWKAGQNNQNLVEQQKAALLNQLALLTGQIMTLGTNHGINGQINNS